MAVLARSKITRLIDSPSAVFLNLFFSLEAGKTQREFVRFPPNFDSGWINI